MIKTGEKYMEMEENKELKIFGISIWKIFAYFILYSILGYIIETIYGIITTGLWQCRQSFLYGPFLRDLWSWSCHYYCICKLF